MEERIEALQKEYDRVIEAIDKEKKEGNDDAYLHLLTDLLCAIRLHTSALAALSTYIEDEEEEVSDEEDNDEENKEELNEEDLMDKISDLFRNIAKGGNVKVRVIKIK